MLALRTVGRRTGTELIAILGYFEDGPDLVTRAMNGWGVAEPAWWLNLQAHPDATVDKNLDQYAALRSRETAVVIFEPQHESAASQSVGG